MQGSLSGKKVAILLADGFEEAEMTEPRRALQRAGAQTELISPRDGSVQGVRQDRPGIAFPVDVPLSRANPEDYDALLLPGTDILSTNKSAQQFIRAMTSAGKPIAAISHGFFWVRDTRASVTRNPADIPAFNAKMVETFGSTRRNPP